MTTPLSRYGQTQKSTASKERLLVMLLEKALAQMQRAKVLLETQRSTEATPPLSQASDIVVELLATLDTARAPELSQTLSDVYLFVSDRLLKATLTREPAWIREAERVFAPIVEAFQQAVASLPADAPEAR